MKIISVLVLLPFICFSQKYERNFYDYEKLKLDTLSVCDEEVLQSLENAFVLLQENNSNEALKIAKIEFEKSNNCPQVFEIYGYSLFRNGQWFQGVELLDN